MPVVINDQTYYMTAEVCRMIGIIRNTLFRRLKEGIFSMPSNRGWRTIYHSLDGDHQSEDQPCCGNKSGKLNRWIHEISG
jgi:hypothetical protein